MCGNQFLFGVNEFTTDETSTFINIMITDNEFPTIEKKSDDWNRKIELDYLEQFLLEHYSVPNPCPSPFLLFQHHTNHTQLTAITAYII